MLDLARIREMTADIVSRDLDVPPISASTLLQVLDRAIAAEALLHRCVRAMPPGPMCRDCADHNGTCQSDGKTPCDSREALPQQIAALAAYRATKEQSK